MRSRRLFPSVAFGLIEFSLAENRPYPVKTIYVFVNIGGLKRLIFELQGSVIEGIRISGIIEHIIQKIIGIFLFELFSPVSDFKAVRDHSPDDSGNEMMGHKECHDPFFRLLVSVKAEKSIARQELFPLFRIYPAFVVKIDIVEFFKKPARRRIIKDIFTFLWPVLPCCIFHGLRICISKGLETGRIILGMMFLKLTLVGLFYLFCVLSRGYPQYIPAIHKNLSKYTSKTAHMVQSNISYMMIFFHNKISCIALFFALFFSFLYLLFTHFRLVYRMVCYGASLKNHIHALHRREYEK